MVINGIAIFFKSINKNFTYLGQRSRCCSIQAKCAIAPANGSWKNLVPEMIAYSRIKDGQTFALFISYNMLVDIKRAIIAYTIV